MDLSIKVEEKLRNGPNNKVEMQRAGQTNSSYTGTSNISSFKTQSGSFSPSLRSSSVYSYTSSSPSNTTPRGNSAMPVVKPVGKMRRLSEKELQRKREKGECFRCDEKWSVGHRCKKKC